MKKCLGQPTIETVRQRIFDIYGQNFPIGFTCPYKHDKVIILEFIITDAVEFQSDTDEGMRQQVTMSF